MQGKILIASDEPVLNEFLKQSLPEQGYQIIPTTVDESLEVKLAETDPDLVLLDIAMPRMDGIEQCLDIRRHSPVAIIMLSTWGAGPNKIRGLDLSSASYLTEPFGVDELLERIGETLRREDTLSKAGTSYAGTVPLDTNGIIDHTGETTGVNPTVPSSKPELCPAPATKSAPSNQINKNAAATRGILPKNHFAAN
jgi:DNA-binding response OmpR family regulator